MATVNLFTKNLKLLKYFVPTRVPSANALCSVRHLTVGPSLNNHRWLIPRVTWCQQPNLITRSFSKSPEEPQVEPEKEENFEEHEQTIYKGILATQIKLVKSFSLLTSAIGLSCQPVIFSKMLSVGEGSGNLALVVASGAFLSFFTFATPLLIHWVSKKYVVELMYNKIDDTYTAITYSLLLRKKQVKFQVNDVYVPDIPGMFTTFKVKDVPLFVDGDQFDGQVQSHYVKLMGYDKPINLRWEGDHTQSEAEARKRKEEKQN